MIHVFGFKRSLVYRRFFPSCSICYLCSITCIAQLISTLNFPPLLCGGQYYSKLCNTIGSSGMFLQLDQWIELVPVGLYRMIPTFIFVSCLHLANRAAFVNVLHDLISPNLESKKEQTCLWVKGEQSALQVHLLLYIFGILKCFVLMSFQ